MADEQPSGPSDPPAPASAFVPAAAAPENAPARDPSTEAADATPAGGIPWPISSPPPRKSPPRPAPAPTPTRWTRRRSTTCLNRRISRIPPSMRPSSPPMPPDLSCRALPDPPATAMRPTSSCSAMSNST